MKFYSAIFSVFLFILSNSQGLSQEKVPVTGTILDSLETPLTGASVMLMHQKDSLLEGFAIADKNGQFKIRAQKPGAYILQITFVGYGMFARHLSINEQSNGEQLGRIVLNPDAVLLNEATVKATFIPIQFKGDTVEYKADAFKTKPGAVVEDLLKKLPGVQVEKDGTIKAQGEEVKNILVDGKEFFDNDPKIASKNIPADVVDKVQVFDKSSDFSAFTGIDDGRDQKTINLAIKEGKNKGTFGKIRGGYGTDNRRIGALNVNRFDSKMQLSAIANANNLNEQAFSVQDFFEFSGGLEEGLGGGEVSLEIPEGLLNNSGITDALAGGLNFNYDFSKKTSFRSNYFANYSNNTTRSSSDLFTISDGGLINNNGNSNTAGLLKNHRLNLNLKHKPGDSQQFKTKFKANWTDSENDASSYFNSYSPDGQLTNQSISNTRGLNGNTFWEGESFYMKKLNKNGRFISAEAALGNRVSTGNSFLENELVFFPGSSTSLFDSVYQQQNMALNQFSGRIRTDYVEPIAKAQYLNITLETKGENSAREVEFADETEKGFYERNDDLSNAFERQLYQNTAGLSYRYITENLRFSVGTDFQNTLLKNDDFSGQPVKKSFNNWLPSAGFNYQIDKSNRLTARYNSSVRVPTPEELQPAIQNADPLNITIGNPDLREELTHRLSLRFSHFDMFYFRSLFLGNVGITDRAIVNDISIDENLVRTFRPANSGQEFSANGYFDFNTPITGVDLKIGTGGDINYQNSNLLINGTIDQSKILNWNQHIEIENKIKTKVDILTGYRIGIGRTTFEKAVSQNQTNYEHRFYGDFIWYLPKNWIFETNYSRRLYSKNDYFTETGFDFLDIAVSKSFLKNLITVSVEGKNLFDETQSISRNSFGNQYFERITNRLGRILMLKATYRIRSFGK